MNKKYVFCIVYAVMSFCLVGCVAPTNSLQSDIQARINAEEVSWIQLDSVVLKQCGLPEDPDSVPVREKVVQQSKCVTALTNKIVKPHAIYPDLLQQMRDKIEFLSGQYADGKLSSNERQYASKQLWQDYEDAKIARANQILSVSQEQQAVQSAYWGQAFGQIADTFEPHSAQAYQKRLEEQQQQKPLNCVSTPVAGKMHTSCR
jgi:hypothetical protein